MFCSRCGFNIAPSTMLCPGCGAETGVRRGTPASPSVPLQTTLQSATPALRISYAGFWMRFLAWMIDASLLTGLSFLVLFRLVNLADIDNKLFHSLQPFGGMDDLDGLYAALGIGATVFFWLFYIAASWLYHAFMESSAWQGTIGKRALGLVVTDTGGAKVTFGRASGRYFSRLVTALIPLGIGYLLAGFTRQKQALHDLIANCLVLRKAS